MKKLLLSFALICSWQIGVFSQTNNVAQSEEAIDIYTESPVVHPTKVIYPIYFDVSPALRDMPVEANRGKTKRSEDKRTPGIYKAALPDAPYGADPIRQKAPVASKATPIIVANFAGSTNDSYPPDCNGAVGPSHFFQAYNTQYVIYDKTGTTVAGPTNYNTLFSGVTGATRNDGDPIILWDEQAQRWMAAEFSLGTNNVMLVAVSTSSDPTGTWYRWSFDVADMPDYMKFGVWQDGYYMATNTNPGTDVYAFDRTTMIAGGASPAMLSFDNPNRPTTFDGFHCIMPLDNDGAFAPAGTPAMFITVNDGAWQTGTSDQLWIYELDADWATPANSTFSRTQQISVPAFDSEFSTSHNWNDISQQGTTQKLDGLSFMLMYRAQYRNFGTSQHIIVNHTVDVATSQGGIRWYELIKSGSTWSIRQNGTYAPDTYSRWNGSIAMNGNKEIGLAYSISSSSLYPGLRFTGQSQAEYANASGLMDVTETVIANGTTYQASANRWGDYAALTVDPADDNTFWFSSEYAGVNTITKRTQVIAFRFQNDNNPQSFNATAVASDQIDLSWSLNTSSNPVLVAWSATGTFGTPVNGTGYTAGNSIPGGGTVLYYGTGTSFNHTGLTASTTYYYKAWSNTGSYTWSTGVTDNATTPGAAINTFPFTLDFESSADYTTDFSPWTTVDGDGQTTYTSSDANFTGEGTAFAYMAMNPALSGWTAAQGDAAHGGSRCGMAVCPADQSQSNDWFISPAIHLGTASSFSLWVLSPKPGTWGNDEYQILVSTTDNLPASFTAISSVVEAPATWTQHTYSLAAYDNQTIYLAIKHVSTDMFMFWMDDLAFTSTVSGCNSATVVTNPSSSAVCPGSTASFTVSATGDAPITYQWQKNGSNISGATSSTYTIASTVAGDAGTYRCVVTNSCGTDNSADATLTMNTAPTVTTHPSSATQCAGTNVTFTSAASGTATLSYQWQKNGTNVTGATSASYTINNIAAGDAGTYHCVVTNTCGNATTNDATLTVTPGTSISSHPSSMSANVGGTASFTVSASGTGLSYQWKKDGVNLTDGGSISGATTASLTITNVTTADFGTYTCLVTGSCGSIESNGALLTVLTVIAENGGSYLDIFPNPSEGLYVVDFGSKSINGKLTIYDAEGKIIMWRLVRDENTININLLGRAEGIYYLKLEANDEVSIGRLILKK
jgi:hypothetical protein